jgi:hypothetical protein
MSGEGCIVIMRIIGTTPQLFPRRRMEVGARGGEPAAARARGGDCRSLFRVPVTFCGKLGPDHIGDQVVLIAHELHHFGGCGDGIGRRFDGIAPLACHHISGQTDRD